MAEPTIDELVKDLNTAASSYKNTDSGAARVDTIKAARNIITALDDPADALLQLTYTPAQFLALKVAVDLRLCEAIVESEEPISLAELAEKVKASKVLVERLVRTLVSFGYVGEKDARVYTPTKMTHYMVSRKGRATVDFIWIAMPSISRLPKFLEETSYKNPSGVTGGPFQYAENIETSIWEWLPKDPKNLDACSAFMEADQAARPLWSEWFPIKEQLLDGSSGDANEVLMVDSGGGRGHDLTAFKKAHPDAPGRLVLQDLPQVVNDIKELHPNIEKMEHDFFKPQPVKGARIYYMKFILHDWSDEDSKAILGNIKDAMTKGYSRLVIEEFVLPDKACPLLPATWDLEMMAFCNSMERSRTAWKELLESAGLRVSGIWTPPRDGLSIIVSEVA